MRSVLINDKVLRQMISIELNRMSFGNINIEVGKVYGRAENGELFEIFGLEVEHAASASPISSPKTVGIGKLRLAASEGETL